MLYLTNAFSLNMVATEGVADVKHLDHAMASWKLNSNEFVNAIGHVETDRIVRNLLKLAPNKIGSRISVSLNSGDVVIVAQYVGPRLPEGAKELPEGAGIRFMEVTWKTASNLLQ